jgi:hypothetical protein
MFDSPNQISEFLGIKVTNPLALMSEIEKGLPSKALERVVKSIAPPCPARTMSPRRAGRQRPDLRHQISRHHRPTGPESLFCNKYKLKYCRRYQPKSQKI